MGHGHHDDHHHGPKPGTAYGWAGVIIFAFLTIAWFMASSGVAARKAGKLKRRVLLRSTSTGAMKLPSYSSRAQHASALGKKAKLTGESADRANFVARYDRGMRRKGYKLRAVAVGREKTTFRVVFGKPPGAATIKLITGAKALHRAAAARGFRFFQVIVGRRAVFHRKL